MSRAVDAKVAAAIKVGDSQDVYNDVVAALYPKASDLLEIEFLGSSHPLPSGCNVLVEGSSIALPKTKVVQAFVVARKILFKCLDTFREEDFQNLRDSTAVILLMDPEHITAANVRKRVIKRQLAGSKVEFVNALKRELLVVDSYLTSRLHRHTKSPTLWGHRRWVLQVSKSVRLPHSLEQDLTTIVLVAAERHPRNYYAWLHIRGLFAIYDIQADDLTQIASVVKDWCLKHPGDTSGWSFLLFCLSALKSSKTSRTEVKSAICRDVLHLTVSFQWTHESVWVFLRTLVATGEVDGEVRASFFQVLNTMITAQYDGYNDQSVLRAAKDWTATYQQTTDI